MDIGTPSHHPLLLNNVTLAHTHTNHVHIRNELPSGPGNTFACTADQEDDDKTGPGQLTKTDAHAITLKWWTQVPCSNAITVTTLQDTARHFVRRPPGVVWCSGPEEVILIVLIRSSFKSI